MAYIISFLYRTVIFAIHDSSAQNFRGESLEAAGNFLRARQWSEASKASRFVCTNINYKIYLKKAKVYFSTRKMMETVIANSGMRFMGFSLLHVKLRMNGVYTAYEITHRCHASRFESS